MNVRITVNKIMSDFPLQPDFLNPAKLLQKPTRDGYGLGLVEAGEKDPNVVALCADLTESTRTEWFAKKFPERFIEVGVAEQNLAALASGLAAVGKVPFMASYATFSPGRNWEQIRTTICLNNQPVKICGAHAGISVGPDGATHQALEDLALMRVLPNMAVIVPADSEEARKATLAAAVWPGPVYLRFGRSATPVFTLPESPFKIGEAYVLKDGSAATIVSTGSASYTALKAAYNLEKAGLNVRVLHCPTLKPMNEAPLLAAARETKRLITLEEHQVVGGLGGAVAEIVSSNVPVPILRLGIGDCFGQSGEPSELMRHFGIDEESVTQKARGFISH